MVRRAAFTMIELIMAIVIMGIVFISLPMIIMGTGQQSAQNIVQEAVFLSAAQMGQVLTYHWDNNSPDLNNTLAKAEALSVNSGHALLNRLPDSNFRVGHFVQPLHRRMSPPPVSGQERSATNVGNDGTFNDIDDFDGQSTTLTVTGTNSKESYKNPYTFNMTVRYVDDTATFANTVISDYNFESISDNAGATAAASSTNVKRIVVTASTPNDGVVVRLYSFSSNIGETDYYRRTF